MKKTVVLLAGALLLSTAGTPLSADSLTEPTAGVEPVGDQVAAHPVPHGDGVRNIRVDRLRALREIDRDRMAAVLALLLIGQVPRETATFSVQTTGLSAD